MLAHRAHFDPFNPWFHRSVNLLSPSAIDWDANALANFKVDIRETDSAYTMKVELPGVPEDKIVVQVDGDTVSISAELSEENTEEKDGRILRQERVFGKFSRAFQLGQSVDSDNATAKSVNGVLHLTLPKKLAKEGKRLVVTKETTGA